MVLTSSPLVNKEELKDHMGITYDELDAQINLHIESACSIIEYRTGSATRTITWLYQTDCVEGEFVNLPYEPVDPETIVITYYSDGSPVEAIVDVEYQVLTDNTIQWLITPLTDSRPDSVQYVYQQKPHALTHLTKLAILNVAMALFDNKGDQKALADSWIDRILQPLATGI